MAIIRNFRGVIKVFLVAALVLTIFSLNVASMFSQEIDIEETLQVAIQEVSFDTTSRQLDVSVSVENETDIFIGEIGYSFELYLGDALQEEGFIFDSLEYQMNQIGDIGNLGPYEKLDKALTITLPETLTSGNYFFRMVVGDQTQNYVALDYTEEPIELTGSGGFLGSVDSYFRTSSGDSFSTEGWLVEPTETPSVIIRLDENPKLQEYLKTNDLYAESEVFNISGRNQNKPIHHYETQKLTPIIDDTEEIIKIDLTPWEGISPDPYSVLTLLKNKNGQEVASPIMSRWLVNGFSSRILDVQTGTNSYDKGDNLDLRIEVGSFGFVENQYGEIAVTFLDKDAQKYTFSQGFVFGEEVSLDFSNQKTKEKFNPISVQVSLTSPNFGEELDYFEMEIPQNSIFKRDLSSNSDIFQNILLILIIILIGIVLWAIIKEKGDKKFFALIGLIVVVLLTLFILSFNLNKTNAALTQKQKRTTTLSFINAKLPKGNLGMCPQSTGISFSVRAACKSCFNGVTGTAAIYPAGSNKVLASVSFGDPGHYKKPYLVWGPVKYNPTVTSALPIFSYRIGAGVKKGAWCYAANITAGPYTISCTPPTSVIDVCANIDGIQESVPNGLILEDGDQCVPPPTTSEISAICEVSNYGVPPSSSVIEVQRYNGERKYNNEIVKWQVKESITGGNGKYTYEWILSDSPNGDEDSRDRVYRTRYNSGGIKTASVKIISGDQEKIISCGTAHVDMCDNLDGVQRKVPDGYIFENYQCDLDDDGGDNPPPGRDPNGGPNGGPNDDPDDDDPIIDPSLSGEIEFEVKPILSNEDGNCPAFWTVSNVTSCDIISASGNHNQPNVAIYSGEQTGQVDGGDEYYLSCIDLNQETKTSNSYRCNISDLTEY